MTNAKKAEAHKSSVMERLSKSMDECSKTPALTACLRSVDCRMK